MLQEQNELNISHNFNGGFYINLLGFIVNIYYGVRKI